MVEENAKLNPFENVPRDKWNDWRWQIENRINKISQLAGILKLSSSEAEKYGDILEKYHFSITPYYMSLIDISDEKDPIRLQCFPDLRELDYLPGSLDDPLDSNAWEPLFMPNHT